MKNKHQHQSNTQQYINIAKNVARLGLGSALVLVHLAIIGGNAMLARRALKQQSKDRALKALPYEK